MWSNEPWETPIIKIKSKHKIDEILKLLYFKSKIKFKIVIDGQEYETEAASEDQAKEKIQNHLNKNKNKTKNENISKTTNTETVMSEEVNTRTLMRAEATAASVQHQNTFCHGGMKLAERPDAEMMSSVIEPESEEVRK